MKELLSKKEKNSIWKILSMHIAKIEKACSGDSINGVARLSLYEEILHGAIQSPQWKSRIEMRLYHQMPPI